MRDLRIVLVGAAISLVFVQGVRGAMLGLVLLALNELLVLRERMREPGTLRLRPRWLRRPWRRRRPSTSAFPAFDTVVSETMWSARGGREFDATLRRRLTRIVDAKLLPHDLDLRALTRDPERAQALLGRRLWTVVDPDRPMSGERSRGGVSLRDLNRLLDDVDAIEKHLGAAQPGPGRA